ncbi:MAG: hypothetical protein OXG58_04040 [Gemmatimonadetes bacterium]|nr:hypothetical protein [Gemmatimonadota bacterium]
MDPIRSGAGDLGGVGPVRPLEPSPMVALTAAMRKLLILANVLVRQDCT